MTDAEINELIGSRLCHDLISPVSAIGNGLELVMSEPVPSRDDLALLEQSARAAQAALSFNRLAFGARGTADTSVAHRTVVGLINGHLGHGRLTFELGSDGPDLPRPLAKMVMLAVLAAVGTAPFGGRLTLAPVTPSPPALNVSVTGRRVALPDGARAMLERGLVEDDLQPRDVHYLLLHRLATELGAVVTVEPSAAMGEDGEATVRLSIG